MKPKIFKEAAIFCPKGQSADTYQAGDFILVADTTLYGKLVTLGQKLRFGNTRFVQWNHAAIVIDPDTLLEADGKTVKAVKLTDYASKDYYLVRIQASDDDRREAVAFALSCVGDSYGWTTIVSIILSLLTGLKFSFGFDGQEICSGLVARSLERTQAIFPRDPSHITPSELASYYLDETK